MTPTVGEVKEQPQPRGVKENPTAACTAGRAGLEERAPQRPRPSEEARHQAPPRDARGPWGGARRRRGLAQEGVPLMARRRDAGPFRTPIGPPRDKRLSLTSGNPDGAQAYLGSTGKGAGFTKRACASAYTSRPPI